jgi:hypothetical protein
MKFIRFYTLTLQKMEKSPLFMKIIRDVIQLFQQKKMAIFIVLNVN